MRWQAAGELKSLDSMISQELERVAPAPTLHPAERIVGCCLLYRHLIIAPGSVKPRRYRTPTTAAATHRVLCVWSRDGMSAFCLSRSCVLLVSLRHQSPVASRRSPAGCSVASHRSPAGPVCCVLFVSCWVDVHYLCCASRW